MPLFTCKLFGLPRPNTGFWPRLLGAVLIGHAGGLFLEGAVPNVHGMGLGAALIINLSAAFMIAGLLLLDAAGRSRRGKALLWLIVAVLVLVGFAQMAFIS